MNHQLSLVFYAAAVFATIGGALYIDAKKQPVEAANLKNYTVHTGGYSIDHNNLTQTQIIAHVDAIVSAMPNAKFIAIGTYFDYPDQIAMWAGAIHARGRKVFFRSAGFNSWQGTFGAAATGTPDEHRTRVVAWVHANADVFQSGDIFEAVPDEPENGNYYDQFLQGVYTDRVNFNAWVRATILDVESALSQEGVSGVKARYLFTNASAAKDVVDSTTASFLNAIGTDNYPENGALTAAQCATAMQNELTAWVVPAHPSRPKHITFGPSVFTQFSEQLQSECYAAEFAAIFSSFSNLDGITVWQSGADYNPLSRIFEYTNSTWNPRSATRTINKFFK